MPIDPRISLGVQPIQLADPVARYSQIASIQNAQNQNALAQYQLSAAQREQESTNALNTAYQNAYDVKTGKIDTNKLRQSIAESGFGSKLPGIEKSLAELDKERSALEKTNTELLDAKLKQSRGFLDTIDPADPSAPAQYIAWHEANHKDPIVGKALAARGITANQSRAQIEAAIAKGPQAFAQLLNQSKLGTEKFMEMNKPTTQVVDRSGQRDVIQTPGLGGAPNTVGTYTDVPLPANVQAQKIQIAQQSRPPAQPAAPTITQIVDPTNTNQMITIDAKRYQGGGVGSPGVIGVGGKEPGAALRVNKVEQGKTQLADDLENLRASFETLDKLRAVPSTERGPLSNVASGIASTAIGQRTGQFFATEAQVERDVINSARSRLVNSIKNATGMSAQQLNSNVELQTMLKSISDPGQSYQSAIRIIQDIEDAYVTGSGMLPKKDKPGGAPAAAQGTGGFKYLGKESK
jgi:hypothetical protein